MWDWITLIMNLLVFLKFNNLTFSWFSSPFNVKQTVFNRTGAKSSNWLLSLINCPNWFDNLIQLVNIIGSIFYGNVLGIFLLAFFIKYVKSNAVFVAAIITQGIVIIGWWFDWMPYLWLNLFGCSLVMLIAIFIQTLTTKKDLL